MQQHPYFFACQLSTREGHSLNPVDTQTRHALKRDSFVDHAQSYWDWLLEHQSEAILAAVIVIVVVAIGVGSIMFYQHREDEASVAYGAAMDIYSAPVNQPGTPAQAGVRTYPSAHARAQAANAEFVKIANSFGSTDSGKNAQYFAGLTYMEMGNQSKAEQELKKVADHGDKNLASLAKLALAGLYVQNGHQSSAIQILQELVAHPTATVPAGEAQLELAGIYEKTNPQEARQIYAQLKDKDKTTAAGQIATQKLQALK